MASNKKEKVYQCRYLIGSLGHVTMLTGIQCTYMGDIALTLSMIMVLDRPVYIYLWVKCFQLLLWLEASCGKLLMKHIVTTGRTVEVQPSKHYKHL